MVLLGVGPGDPDLLTLAGYRALRAADAVAYPVASLTASGMALTIVERFLESGQRQLPLVFPMVREAEPLRAAWLAAAHALAAEVAVGQRVVFLCEGDVSLFATGSYVLLALRKHHPECPLQVIPGVSSVSAAAAAGAWPLAFQQEALLIRPCPDRPDDLLALLEQARQQAMVLALLKLGHRWLWVQPLLEQQGLLAEALFAERVGWPDQHVITADAVSAQKRPYFSQLLIRQRSQGVPSPPVLP